MVVTLHCRLMTGSSGKDLFGGGIGCQPAAASQLMLGLIYLFSPRSLSNPLYAHTKGWRPQGQLQKGKKWFGKPDSFSTFSQSSISFKNFLSSDLKGDSMHTLCLSIFLPTLTSSQSHRFCRRSPGAVFVSWLNFHRDQLYLPCVPCARSTCVRDCLLTPLSTQPTTHLYKSSQSPLPTTKGPLLLVNIDKAEILLHHSPSHLYLTEQLW